MFENKHIVMCGLSHDAAMAVMGYHNELFHCGEDIGSMSCRQGGSWAVYCDHCEATLNVVVRRIMARHGFKFSRRAKHAWFFTRENPDGGEEAWYSYDAWIYQYIHPEGSVDFPGFRYAWEQVQYNLGGPLPVKSYRITALNNETEPVAGPAIIEAPSPGVAVEYFLAVHGMSGYDRVTVEDLGDGVVPDETIEDVAGLFHVPFTNAFCQELDEHHGQ